MTKTPEEKKELKAIARFYKDCKQGFATNDGYYGVPSNGKKIGVIYEGEILKFCRNESSARNFVELHRRQLKKCNRKTP